MEYNHVPVMLKEVLEYLQVKKCENYLDGTLGGGGYTRAIAELANPGLVVATDADPLAIEYNRELIEKTKIKNIRLVNGNFQNLKKIIETQVPTEHKFAGLVLDLGLSTAQLEDRHRGFSFKLLASPLEMAFAGSASTLNTSEIVNIWSAPELHKIIRDYGEEAFAKRIADNIVLFRQEKKIETVGELLAVIEKSLPAKILHKKGIHWATKTFQALRIATNNEMAVLEQVLAESLTYLLPGARIVVVAYHSLEDRIVKNFFRAQARDCICPPESPICICNNKAKLKIITKKAIVPTASEVQLNPRARSAKLRAAVVV
jgi:16S rRNA (cytosine1402-N4)-methyltransferase